MQTPEKTVEGRDSADPAIFFRRPPADQSWAGQLDVDLLLEGRQISSCAIVPLTLRVGAALVRMDGIGEVGTAEEHRRQGYSRRVLSAAVARMTAGDAALSMLYGIPDFYTKFGYVTSGPEHELSVPATPAPPGPPGWQVRPAVAADLPSLWRLYDAETARAETVGAAVRRPEHYPWSALTRLSPPALATECRVAVDPAGAVAAYAWRGGAFWFIGGLAETYPHDLILAEAVARDATAADALLAGLCAWAGEEAETRGTAVGGVTLALPPSGPLAAAAMQGTATFRQRYQPAGEFMARVLDTERLLASLAPELERRRRAARLALRGALRLETDAGAATLRVGEESLAVETAAPADGQRVVRLPQTVLARLTLGAFPPGDLLERQGLPPGDPARDLLEALFPRRYPHISLPDRF